MPVSERWAYFDHAAVAPLSAPAHAAIMAWADDAARHGDTTWNGWSELVERTRRTAAAMLGALPEEIALVPNTTAGINLVAEGYPWQAGDNVVVPASEFPSNLYPWLNLKQKHVEVRLVPADDGCLDLNRLGAACDARTRIVALSWVGYAAGWRIDVAAAADMAHAHGALLFLDGIQGLGAFPLNVTQTGVDFVAADGHKWMLGPEGAGLFFLRQEHLDRLLPCGIGWHSVVHAGQFGNAELALRPTAARYEGGTWNTGGFVGLGASLELLADAGVERIAGRILDLTDEICRRLGEMGAVVASRRHADHKSGIVAFELPGRNPQAVRHNCLRNRVALACRGGKLRASPHAYNDHSDIDRLICALQEQ